MFDNLLMKITKGYKNKKKVYQSQKVSKILNRLSIRKGYKKAKKPDKKLKRFNQIAIINFKQYKKKTPQIVYQ